MTSEDVPIISILRYVLLMIEVARKGALKKMCVMLIPKSACAARQADQLSLIFFDLKEFKDFICVKERLRPDCADAQADLSLSFSQF